MYGKWAYIAGGATSLVVAGIAATQFSTSDRAAAPQPAAPPPAVVVAAPPPPPPPAPSAIAEAAIARLTAALAEQEAENARLRTVLAVRDGVLETLKATVAERDAALDGLRRELAENSARIATLQASVDAARTEPATFEEAIAALKPMDGQPSAARLEAARAETTDLDQVFAAKLSLGAPLPLAGNSITPAAATASDAPSVQVQFDFASAALTPGGVAHTAAAAVSLRGMMLERVRLIGHTDTIGNPSANRRLADRRARAVAAALVAAGVPEALIEIDGQGEAALPGRDARRRGRAAQPHRRHRRRPPRHQLTRGFRSRRHRHPDRTKHPWTPPSRSSSSARSSRS